MIYMQERLVPLAMRPWRPFVECEPVRSDGTIAVLDHGETFWANAHYLVHRHAFYGPGDQGKPTIMLVHLSLRTVENDVRHDWREMQRVKNDLCGPDWEAVELYPAESRVVDTANQYHLWCFPPGGPGEAFVTAFGFNEGRHVYNDAAEEAPDEFFKQQVATKDQLGYAQQRPLESTRPHPVADATEWRDSTTGKLYKFSDGAWVEQVGQ